MQLRFTRLIHFLMAFAAVTSCSDKKSDSDLKGFADIASAVPGPDGNFNVTCKNGTTEKVPGTQLAQACESVSEDPIVANPAVEIKTNGTDYCARYSDDSLKCWQDPDYDDSYVLNRPVFLGNKAKSIDMQYASACAVTQEGAVICWGSNENGIIDPLPSLSMPGAAQKVVVGADAACAITKDNAVACWGLASYSKATNIPSDLGAVADLVAVGYSFCAVRTNGSVKCWGPEAFIKSIPADLADVKNFYGHCALLKNGNVRCWAEPSYPGNPLAKVPPGLQNSTQMSVFSYAACAIDANQAPVCWGDNSQKQSSLPPELKSAVHITVGNNSACAIKKNGEVMCWKFGGETKIPLNETHQAQYLVAKEGAICSLDKDGNRVCWGRNYYTEEWVFGNPSAVFDIDSSVSGAAGVNSQAIALGRDHSCFLQTGYLQCRGFNSAGQGYLYEPVDDGDNLGLVAGNAHNCSLRTDGSVKCWGENDKGQVLVPRDLKAVKAVQAGGDHSCAIAQDGNVRCWGANDFGQSTIPMTLTNATSVALGQNHSCALTGAGTVSCWGDNSQNQLNAPAFDQAVQSIAAGSHHSCAVLQDKSLRCWGSNAKGESATPRALKTVLAVAAGNGFTCAISSADNTVQCWGDNTFGQLEVPAASLVGADLHNRSGDRIFTYGDYSHAPVFNQDKYSLSIYNPVYQEVFAYQGLKGISGENLAYDLSVSYKADCEKHDPSVWLGLAVVNSGNPNSGSLSEVTKGDDNILVFPNLLGAARLIPGTRHSSSPAKTFSFNGIQAATGKTCSFAIKNVAIKPSQNITPVLRNQAEILAKQLEDSFAKWLKARSEDDIRKDGVPKSKENLAARKVRIINETLNILYTNEVSPRAFGINSDEWTEADVEAGLFSELSSVRLLQDEARMDWETVREGRPQAEWPNWAKGLFSFSLPLGKSVGEYIGESLATYNELLDQLKGIVTPLMSLKDAESQLKESVSKARRFLNNTSEVRATISAEIKIIQSAANKGGDVCKKTSVSTTAQQCQ